MRIVFLDNVSNPITPGAGGHSDVVWSLAKPLVKLGEAVTIIGPYANERYPFVHPQLSVVRYPALRCPDRNAITRMWHVARGLWFGRSSVRMADVVHVTDAFSAGVASVLCGHVPVVFTTSGNILQRQASGAKLDIMSAVFYRIVSAVAAKRVAFVIATSNDMKYWWIRTGASPSRVVVQRLGTDMANSGEQGDDNGVACSTTDRSNSFRLLFVGRMVMENNLDRLADVADALFASTTDYRLTVVGTGPELQWLHDRVRAYIADGRLVLVGAVPYAELGNYYRDADAVLITREAGAVPRVGLEAIALGVPVVAFRGGGLDDYIVNGQTGFIVDPHVGAMVDAIRHLRNMPGVRVAISKAAREWAARALDWQHIASAIDRDVYQRIAR